MKRKLILSAAGVVLLAAVSFVSSCARTGIMKDVPVTLVRPDKVVSLSADTTFECTFEEVMHCYDIKIVSDSIIVFYDQASEKDPYHFKAYSTDTFEYMGAFVQKGRGPGEMVLPNISGSSTSGRYLCCDDNKSSTAYMVDVGESLRAGMIPVAESFDIPSDVIYWLPLSLSLQFAMRLENREMVLCVMDEGGKAVRKYTPFGGIDGERCMTYFASQFVERGNKRDVAEIMIFFPQINIIDTESGTIRSIAVDRSYRKWKQVIGSMINMDMLSYYFGATATSEYIIASYRHLPLKSMNESGHGTSFHVFDWEGNFLVDIKVSEDIGNITYDSRRNLLYCLDVAGRVIRYDLSGIL